MSLKLEFDDKQIQKWLNKNLRNYNQVFQKIVNETTLYGLTTTKKRLALRKRSGSLGKSYKQKKIGWYSRLIFSELAYADTHEHGRQGRGRIIKAGSRNPRAKFIPIAKEKLKNKSGGLKKLSKKQIKNAVKNGDLVFVKQARMSNIKGKKVLTKKVNPRIQRRLQRNVVRQMKKLGF